MGEKFKNHFNLLGILRMPGLDIRRVSRNSLSLKLGEYYNQLAKFLKYAPLAIQSLHRVCDQKALDNDFKVLENIRGLLESIGSYNFLYIIDDIMKAGKRGHSSFAAECAGKIIGEFGELLDGITKIKKAEGGDAATNDQGEDNINYELYEPQLLKKVLQMLDNEEATRKMRILAIDDAPVMLKTITAILSDEYKVYGLTNPTMLEKFLRQITPELFLLDYQMPERSGFDLIPIIRSFEEHETTPIIFLTSQGTVDHVSSALTLGACDFIVKPFEGTILREKVAKHIVRKKLF